MNTKYNQDFNRKRNGDIMPDINVNLGNSIGQLFLVRLA